MLVRRDFKLVRLGPQIVQSSNVIYYTEWFTPSEWNDAHVASSQEIVYIPYNVSGCI